MMADGAGGAIDANEHVEDLAEYMFGDWPDADGRDMSLLLSSRAEDFVNHLRSEGKNIRTELGGDLYTEGGLDSLRERLARSVGRERDDPHLIAAVGLVATHSARFDWHFDGAETAAYWVDRKLPTEATALDMLALQVAKTGIDISKPPGRADQRVHGQMPDVAVIRRLCAEIGAADYGASGGSDPRPRLKLLLAESITAAPDAWLGTDDGDPYRSLAMEVADQLIPEPASAADQLGARASYIASAMHYAAKELPQARQRLRDALRLTDGTDLPFIERCQYRLDFVNQEEASRRANSDDIQQQVSDSTEAKFKQVEADAVSAMRAETQNEVKDALLRVVEILAVFLAVAGVAVTAVGGIAVEGSAWVRVAVWGFGYATLVSLFLLLRWIVGHPGVRDAWRARKRNRQSSVDSDTT